MDTETLPPSPEQAPPKDGVSKVKDGQAWRELCSKVAANEVTFVHIGDEADDLGELAIALLSCTSVNRITMDLSCVSTYQASLFSILEVLSTTTSLHSFELVKVDFSNSSVVVATSVLLETIAKNKSIRDITIDCRGYSHPPFLQQHAPSEIPAAIAKCTYVESCWLEHLDELLLEQTLLAMRKNKKLKTLSLIPRHYSVTTFEALGVLVGRSSSLATLELHEVRLTAKRFHPVVAALKASKVKELALHHCRLTRPATEMLQYLNDHLGTCKLETLSLGRDVRFSKPMQDVLAVVLHNHRWKTLDLKYQALGKALPRLLLALSEQTNLENLILGTIEKEADIEKFVSMIAKIQGLSSLTLSIPEAETDRVVSAIKTNSDVQSCCINDREIQMKRPSLMKTMIEYKTNRVSDDDYQGMFANETDDRSDDGTSIG